MLAHLKRSSLCRCLLRKLCKYTTRFGNFTWRRAPQWPPEKTTRSQSFKQGLESIFTKTHFILWLWCQNQKYGHYAVNLNFSFQEPVRRKSYAEILNGDDEEDEKVDNSNWQLKDKVRTLCKGNCCVGNIKETLWRETQWGIQGQHTEVDFTPSCK